MSALILAEHPVVADLVWRLRDRRTAPAEFRRVVRRLGLLLGVQATADLPTAEGEVLTPLAPSPARRLAGRIALVPVLRAGLGLAEGVLDLLPESEVWHLGLFRDERSLQPVQYYNKLPAARRISCALVLDPMLATGGSAVMAVDVLQRCGASRVKFVGILGAPEGVAALEAAHPDLEIHLAALDPRLDERGFIWPGLGDAGDRQFGTAET